MKNKPRVLYDLRLAHQSFGFSGIPQDTRLLLQTLASSEALSVEGLLSPKLHRFPYGRLTDLGVQATFLAEAFSGELTDKSLAEKILGLIPGAGRAYRLGVRAQFTSQQIAPLHPALVDVVWREFLASTLNSDSKSNLDKVPYFLSSLGHDRSALTSLYSFPKPKLKVEGFDFLVTQDSLSVSLPPTTRHVVRYHDGLPVLASDTTPQGSSRHHMGDVLNAAKDALYVCNTPSALNDLALLRPKLAEQAVVIPYSLPHMKPFNGEKDSALASIFSSRRSKFSKEVQGKVLREKQPGRPYILSLATIEPRKNYELLIKAWQRLQLKLGYDIDLVIVGKPGWKFTSILDAMRPYLLSGRLHHLEGVAQDELPVIYSGAKLFVFPSFAEGFGLPPIEAMSCGVPTIMSDIPAHRFSGGKAAAFFNPYDAEALTQLMWEILGSDSKQKQMIDLGFENTTRFTDETTLPLWEELFKSKGKRAK